MWVVARGAAVEGALALPVGHALAVGAVLPVACPGGMALFANTIRRIDINRFVIDCNQLVAMVETVAVEAPEFSVAVLQCLYMGSVQCSLRWIGLHIGMAGFTRIKS